ncbi:MAG: hypothetical protein WAL63_06110 [Solirubrobacteraceae bacterium]
MPESRLFLSSLSRRQLARRRPGRSHLTAVVLLALLLVLAGAAAFFIERGGI